MKVHHIGIIVKNIEKSLRIYEKLKYTPISDLTYDEIQKIKILFIKSFDQSQVLELIESCDETSSIYNFKDGYHHICYEINDNNFMESFKNMRIGKIFTKIHYAPAIDNRKVIFGCLANGTFVEFLL